MTITGEFPANDESVNEEMTEQSVPKVDDGTRLNFADNEELVKKAREVAVAGYEHNKTNRYEYEEIWRLADDMYKTGQNASIRERERQRTDRQAANGESADTRDLTLTKAYKKGSTLFFRQVRTLASQILSVLQSKPDPYKYAPIYGTSSFASRQQANDLAEQHNLLNRWARKRDKFDLKCTDLIFKLIKYGNQPICVGWNRNHAKRIIRVPIYGQATSPDQDPPIVGYEFDTGVKMVENQPSLGIIPLENFWPDPAVGCIQKQTCIVVDDYLPLSIIQQNEIANKFYVNTDKITKDDEWDGARDDSRIDADRALSSGLDSDVDRTNSGLYKTTDVYVMLPMDEKGKWDEKLPMQKYWLTFVGNSLSDAKCVRFERNPDPEDEWPIEMLHALPDDDGKLYHFGYAEALRGDFEEQSTTRQQMIDNRTLQMNKPLKAIQGEVFNKDLRFGKDKIYWVEKENSLTEFGVIDVQQSGLLHLSYFDDDANRAAGTDKPLMGEYAGARTSATESSIVSQNAANPHIMLAKYVLHRFLEFHARKSLWLWQIYGDNDQVHSLTEKQIERKVMPGNLFGEYDVEINLVDEFETNALNIQTMTQAVQTLVPLFSGVMDLPKVGADVFGKIVKGIDVLQWFKTNGNKDAIQLADHETRAMVDGGTVLSPAEGEAHDVHLNRHEAELTKWLGAEDQNPNLVILKRHIAMTKGLKQMEAQMANMMRQTPNAMTGNQTPGEAQGNALAGAIGAAS